MSSMITCRVLNLESVSKIKCKIIKIERTIFVLAILQRYSILLVKSEEGTEFYLVSLSVSFQEGVDRNLFLLVLLFIEFSCKVTY